MSNDFPDHVPAALRKRWAEEGHYPGQGIYELFRHTAMSHPERVAVIDDHGRVTYSSLHEQVLRMAACLLNHGVVTGQVVAVQLANSTMAVAMELAVAAVGAVCLPFPVGRGRAEVGSLLRRSRARVLVAATQHH